MHSSTSLLALILSFVSFAISGSLHSGSHSSRLAKNSLSSRQFHYPRALTDVCADVDLSLILGDVLGSLLGDICLCLSAFPLDLDVYADLQLLVNLVGETKLEALVEDNGTQCTYPDHASPQCTSGNVCDFTCTDGFVKNGGACVCPQPSSVCNGKCGSYPNGCSSALPSAPKIARSVTSLRNGRSYNSHFNGLLGSLGITSGGSRSVRSGTDLDALINELLNSLGISVPVPGSQFNSLGAKLHVCTGTGISGTQSSLDIITDVVNSLLSSLLGTTLKCKVESSCSLPANPDTISIDLQVCGLSGDSFESTLDKTLRAVADLLNDLLDGAKIITSCSAGGSECPATPTLSNSGRPLSSPSRPAGIDLSGLLRQVEGILGDLGLSSGNYTLDTDADLTVGVSVGLSDTLSTTDGLVATVIALVEEILGLLLATNITVQTDLNPTSSPTLSNPGQGDVIAVDIYLGVVLDAIISDASNLVDGVLLAVSGVLVDLLDLDVAVNVDGGDNCGCDGSRRASAKQ